MLDTFTNAGSSQDIDIDKIQQVSLQVNKSLFESFAGMPVRVDPSLEGFRWHIAMSQEMLDELKRRENA